MTQTKIPKSNRLRNTLVVLAALLLSAVTIMPVMAASSNAEITSFSIDEQVGTATITSTGDTTGTIAIAVSHGTNRNGLVATFELGDSENATASPASGTARDFTNPVTYVVTAENTSVTKTWTVTVSDSTAYAANIRSYSLLGIDAVQDGLGGNYLTVTIPHGTNLTSLVGTFVLSSGATMKNSSNAVQTSGVSTNNFATTGSVDFVVTAGDATTSDWTVSIASGPSPEANITAFSVPDQTGLATITSSDINSGTITVYVPYGNTRNLVPTFTVSEYATVEPASGVSRDFTTSQTYLVTAEDNRYSKTWTVNVLYGTNTAANITAFNLPAVPNAEPANITTTGTSTGTVTIKVPYGTSLNPLAPSFTVDDGATAAPLSGVSRDFTTSQTYTVTAADGTHTKIWTVTVTPLLNPSADFVSYSLDGYPATTLQSVNNTHGVIEVTVPYGTSVTHMIATFSVPGGSANPTIAGVTQVSTQTQNDFTNYKTYHLIAPDGHTAKDWRVTVIYGTNTAAEILTYSLPGQTGSSVINSPAGTVNVTVPYGTVLTNLNAMFTLSSGANASVGAVHQINGTTLNDFRTPVIYKVTANDMFTNRTWTVNVIVTAPSTAAEITAFSLPGVTGARTAVINSAAGTVNITVPNGTAVTSLVANYAVSSHATGTPLSGTSHDFTNPVRYVITAQDGITTKNWDVYVNIGLKTFTTGVYRPGAGFYLKMDNGSSWAPSTDSFLAWDNAPNDRAIAGDWNGDGRTETGVYRPGAGFYLKMDNGSSWAPSTDTFLAWDNAPNDRAIAGDWNGDGRTETGVYRPGAGFYLKMDNGSSWTPSTDTFLAWDNAANDRPIAGDWNGDGRTETGVYRPGAGFYLKMDNGSSWAPSTDAFLVWDNAPNDLPVAGDWNGDGRTETGVYRPGAGFYLKMDNSGVWNPSTDQYINWDNAAGDLPIGGSFV